MTRRDEATYLLSKSIDYQEDLEIDLKEGKHDQRHHHDKEEPESIRDQIKHFYQNILLHQIPEDDLVTISVKKFNLLIILSFICWLISFAMIMCQIISNETLFSENWFCFLPMWLGSFLGLYGVVQVFFTVCRPSSLISRERKLYLMEHFPQQYEERNYIEHQSLPLMRRLFCWSIVLAIAYSLILIAQVCYYFWFIHMISLWDSMISLIFILTIFMVYMYLVHIFNWIVCVLFSLFVVQLVSKLYFSPLISLIILVV